MAEISYRRHRFPSIVIQHAVWLYLRFTLSYRDVEELLAERGLDISYESVRSWVLKFGPMIARRLRQVRPRPSDRWHLDEELPDTCFENGPPSIKLNAGEEYGNRLPIRARAVRRNNRERTAAHACARGNARHYVGAANPGVENDLLPFQRRRGDHNPAPQHRHHATAGIALVEYLSVGDVTTDRRVLEDRVNLVIGQPRKQRAAPEDLPSFWCRPNQSATS